MRRTSSRSYRYKSHSYSSTRQLGIWDTRLTVLRFCQASQSDLQDSWTLEAKNAIEALTAAVTFADDDVVFEDSLLDPDDEEPVDFSFDRVLFESADIELELGSVEVAEESELVPLDTPPSLDPLDVLPLLELS